MNVVRNAHVGVPALSQSVCHPVLAVLDQARGIVVVVIRVQVPHDDVVPEVFHGGFACIIARDERRTHVSRVLTQDRKERLLIPNHLVSARLFANGREIGVSPGMRRNLVAFAVHALNNACPLRSAVNCTLAKVVATTQISPKGPVRRLGRGTYVMKKVAFTSFSCKRSRSADVYSYGPSSNVLHTVKMRDRNHIGPVGEHQGHAWGLGVEVGVTNSAIVFGLVHEKISVPVFF